MVDYILRLCQRAAAMLEPSSASVVPAPRKRPPSRLRERGPLDLIDLTAQDETTQTRVREAIHLTAPWVLLWSPGRKRRTVGLA
jgi:hypothetical protein